MVILIHPDKVYGYIFVEEIASTFKREDLSNVWEIGNLDSPELIQNLISAGWQRVW